MLRWPIAATAPSAIDNSERTATTWPQSPGTAPKASCRTRANRPIAAILGAEAKKAVTGVGAPS